MEMEEEPNREVILCPFAYVNDHVGFCGSIKKLPSDFVVTEINTSGQLVNEIAIAGLHTSSATLSEQSRLSQQDHKRLKLSPPDPCVDAVQEDSIAPGYLLPSTGEIEDCKVSDLNELRLDKAATLNSFLEESVCEQLGQFALRVKSTWNSAPEPAALSSEFSLGPVLDKRSRASLHSAIRQQYPFLVTVTKCGEIIVKANQDYRELCRLVSEEEACGFLRFLDAKLDNSKFAFRPDGDKEHRTRVHHFISKKFGKLVETKSFPDSQQKVVIMVRFREKSSFRKRESSGCTERLDIYTAFTLQKENLETLEAISYLSSKLGVLPSDFSYTGIKDKRAVTYQAMVVKKVSPQRGFGEKNDEDPKGTLAMLPDFKVREKMLLRALNRYGVNHEGCTRGLLSIPHPMRIFYVHAYCSKIWNEAAAYRIKVYGTRVVSGDLIFCEKRAESSLTTDKVHIVTPEEEIANKYTINQVILPMAGYSIQYPTNQVGEWYRERLARDGLQTCTFRLPALQLNVPGCYRHLLKQPHNLSYSLTTGNKKEIGNGDHPLQDSEDSLSLSFWLDPSCYATVCLREIMKCDL
ncbi:hypothetical protein lerEdw1_003968 [Lerista edwardsae]|nr:hypothetical protein lerEdw1_003968 [Lerista edwardsae]